MSRAIILTVDDDAAVSKAITRDLRAHYGERYRVVRSTSGEDALATLEELQRRDQAVALIVSVPLRPSSPTRWVSGREPRRPCTTWS
jgi:hypothetical protein